jgi:hypothetical protein
MEDVRLSAGDLCELTAVPAASVHWLTKHGLLKPTEDTGPGGCRLFGLMSAVALLWLRRWQEEGLPSWRGPCRYLAGLSVEQMEKAIEAGRRFLLPLPGGKATLVALPEEEVAELAEAARAWDLAAIYGDIIAKVPEIVSRPPGHRNMDRNPWKRKRPPATAKRA